MSEISINLDKLEEKIVDLKRLKVVCQDINNTAKIDRVGSGQSIEVLEFIDGEYDLIKKKILELLDNSISFFENVKTSVKAADKSASEG